MRLMADEGIDRQIVERLRQEGHEVLYIAELDPGITDEVVLAEAHRGEALLITSDKDFGELIYRQARIRSGVLLLRLAGLSQERKAEVVSSCLNTHGEEMLAAFSVLSPGSLRIRSPL